MIDKFVMLYQKYKKNNLLNRFLYIIYQFNEVKKVCRHPIRKYNYQNLCFYKESVKNNISTIRR